MKISRKEPHSYHYVKLSRSDPAFKGTGLRKTSYFYATDVRLMKHSEVLYYRGLLGKWTGELLLVAIKRAIGKELP